MTENKKNINIEETTPQSNNKFKNFIIRNVSVFRSTFYFMILSFILLSLFISNIIVPTPSMDPTIKVSDRLIVNRLAYSNDKKPEREDIVVFNYPDNEKVKFIKRCMGLPGEILEIKDGILYINNEKYDEPFLAEPYNDDFGPFYIPKIGDIVTLYNGYCCVGEYIVGEESFLEKYCDKQDNVYIVKNNCYFMLGDNGNNSVDSRYWEYRFVTQDKIMGKTIFKYFPKLSKVE